MGNSDCAGVVMEADGQTGRRSILKNWTGNRIWVIRGLKVLSLLAAVLASVILFHKNPEASPQEELIKKALSCAVIFGVETDR